MSLHRAGIFATAAALGLLATTASAQTPSPAEPEAMLRPEGLSEAEQAEFDAYERALSTYRSEFEDFQTTVREIVGVEYRRERQRRIDFYNGNIETLKIEERARRATAIEEFEQFIARYPSNASYTPDVLFRLAELYFEQSKDDYEQADTEYQRDLEYYELGVIADQPTEPRRELARTIATFRRLIRDFPNYRQIDGAYYLLGVCYEQQDEYELALASYRQLVEGYPQSDFAQEGFLRIGEYYFEATEFQAARDAYLAAYGYGRTKWYDKVLFKLGWATYLLNEYDAAIGYFRELLDFYAEEDRDNVAALRQEALQYFAIAVAEEDWDLDGERDPDFVMGRVARYIDPETTYASELMDRLAGILMENQRFEYAIEVNERAIALFECDARNIDRALQIVEAYSSLRDLTRALEMQRMLTTQFGPGSEWYSCQEREGNTDAMAQAEQVVKDNLVETAARYYLQAQDTMNEAIADDDAAMLAQAQAEFAFAAEIYGDFLRAYPDDPLSYEMQMYHAQALLYAAKYPEAAAEFAAVRDSVLSDEFMEVAAALAIQTYEQALEVEIDAYRLEGRAWPAYDGPNAWHEPEEDEDSNAPRTPPATEAIPALSLSWANAIDRYLELGLTSEDDPAAPTRYAYQVAKLYYDYGHHAEARAGFERVLDVCNPEIDESGYAAGFLINSYRRNGDDVRELLDDFQTGRYRACVPPTMLAEILADVTRVSLGQRAERAEQYFAEGRYEEAAEEYARIATEYRDDPEFAPLGVWNSGLIYEQQLQKYERAIAQFDRLITEYPQSEYVDDAWVRIAINAKRFFDFDRAIDAFMRLDQMGFSDPELVQFPLLDAALLMESVGRKREAAEAYQRFVRENPRDSRAPGALYAAGVIYDELGETRTMRTVFQQFRDTYGRSTSTAIDIDAAVIDSYYRSAKAYEAAGDPRSASRDYDRILAEYSTRLPEAVPAKYAAALVVYNAAMGTFDQWNSIRFGETVQSQQRALASRRDGMEPVVLAFRHVADYGSAEWTACAFYQEGRVFQSMADLLYELPVPDFGDDYDAEDEYRLMVEDFASQYEDQAIAAWETAYPLMRELGVTNQCTIDMTAQLNRYRGEQYPVFRTAVQYEEVDMVSPPGFQAPPEAEESAEVPSFQLAAPGSDAGEN
ncbi:MAG: tetratricopeptide repeat protein [Myxococcales bacterium]|nr:tetratricopeptide repeat protein [Myxococcales bacterium]